MSNSPELRARKASQSSQLGEVIIAPNLTAVVLFCAIGMLTTFNLILRFPDLGMIIAQFNQF